MAKRPRRPGVQPPRPDMERGADDPSLVDVERFDPERPLVEPPPNRCPHGIDIVGCRQCIDPKVRRVVVDERTGQLRIGGVLQDRGFIPAAPSSRYGEKLAARRERAKADDDDADDE